jgi:Capsule assembly protein Wzi
LKKIFLIFLLFPILAFAQSEYVDISNPVYDYLERMETLQIISNYNSFEIPKTRNEIASYLKQVIKNENKLDKIDREILSDLKNEFEFEIFGTLNNSESLIAGKGYDLFSQDRKYIYYYTDPGNANIFINLIGQGQGLFLNDIQIKSNESAAIGLIGGELRGTFLNRLGVFIHGTNGDVFGNRKAAVIRNDLKYNFKFNEADTSRFFDETFGYLDADFNLVKFKIGRDRMNIGYGPVKALLGSNAPMFDYLGFSIKYKFFNFSYFHGKLLGPTHDVFDPISGNQHVVEEKYIGYHRIGFDLPDCFKVGIGEFIIYGDRPIDLSYLNPFNFYKSAEHANQDRDNSMLFMDLKSNTIEGLSLYSTLLIDDITFSKLGTGWYGNQTLLNLGLSSDNFYRYLPLNFQFEYIKIDPYVFTHRFIRNNYTNFGYKLGSFLDPNSELFQTNFNYRINYRLSLSAVFSYTIHGANPKNPDGTVKQNVGGDISLGHRISDSDKVNFLDGDHEYLRKYSFKVSYEPFKQINFDFYIDYSINSLQNALTEKVIESFLSLDILF